MAKIDLIDAYFLLPIHKDRRKYLKLQLLHLLYFQKYSNLLPPQKTTYLGFSFDSKNMTMSAPMEKSEKILQPKKFMQAQPKTTIRYFARFIGIFSIGIPRLSLWLVSYKKLQKRKI